MIDEPACTGTCADADTADDRTDNRGRECTAERDGQEKTEQQATHEDRDRWREDDLCGTARGRFFLPILLAAIAAAARREPMALAARCRATAALHDWRVQTIATGGHPKVLLSFGDAASDLDLVEVRQAT